MSGYTSFGYIERRGDREGPRWERAARSPRSGPRPDPDAGAPAPSAGAAALEEVYPGLGVLHANIAGTLPATALFERELGAKTLFFSFSTADENLHAPNEFLRLPRLREGMRAWEALWRLLAAGRLGKGDAADD